MKYVFAFIEKCNCQRVSVALLTLALLCGGTAKVMAAATKHLSLDKRQYEYATPIVVKATVINLPASGTYEIRVIDGYNRMWFQKDIAGNGEVTFDLAIPKMKGCTLVLMQGEAGSEKQLFQIPLIIKKHGSRKNRPGNFVNQPYGGDKEHRNLYKALRNIGCNGGMAYMWTSGKHFAANDMEYYHEYISMNKRDIQNTSFMTHRTNWRQAPYRGSTVDEAVLGHGEWKKKTLETLAQGDKAKKALEKYTNVLEKKNAWAEKLMTKDRPWEYRERSAPFNWNAFLSERPTLGKFLPEYFFHRPFNYYDKHDRAFVLTPMQKTADEDWPNQAFGYSLGDEVSNTFFANPFDYDYSDTTLEQFRVWLQKKYASLETLNTQWGSSFSDWNSKYTAIYNDGWRHET